MTINNYLRNMSAFFNWCVEEGLILRSPVKRRDYIKVERRPLEFVSDEDFRKLLRNMNTASFSEYRDYIIIQLLLDTGMRINECLMIQVTDVNLPKRYIYLPAENTKGKKGRHVFFSDKMATQLQRWIKYKDRYRDSDFLFCTNKGKFLEVSNFEKNVRKYAQRIGLKDIHETYQLDVERAEKAPGSRNDILAKRFNIPMEGYTYFFPYEETLPHRHRDYWQMPCALGADLSQGDDFCAFTFLFPMANGFFGVKTRDYITSYTLSKLPQAMRQKYDQFMQEGTLQVFDGTVLDMMQVYDDLDNFIQQNDYDVRCFGYDPYNAKDFVERWCTENAPFGVEKVIQGAKTESVPLGELKKLSEQRKLLFDEALMQFAMGNCIALEDTNGNRKLLKRRSDQKIDAVAAMMDAYIAWKMNREAFE